MKQEVLKDFRKRHFYTVPEMASALGISLSMYEKVEGGYRNMSGDFLRRFKKAFPDFDINKFFTEIKQD